MTKSYYLYSAIRYLIDIPLLISSFFIAKIFDAHVTPHPQPLNAISFLFLAISAWYIVAQFTRIYNDLRSNKFSEEIIYIVYNAFLFTILLTSFLFIFRKYFYFQNHFLYIYVSVSFLLVLIFKYILRKYLHSTFYRGQLQDRVILIGSTDAAKEFYETLEKNTFYGYKCVGFLDNDSNKLNGCKFLGKVDDLESVLNNIEVDEVIIALPNSHHDQIKSVIQTCDNHAKRLRMIPDLHLYTSSNPQIHTIGQIPVFNLRSLPQDKPFNKYLKRVFDIVFSLIFFLTIGWWFIPVIALLVKITSKGPVFFKQERWGLNNKKIICYKFRTMYHNCGEFDKNGNFLQASKDDNRITKLGKKLREWNIDEFPQFYNVLRGDMSVVGPRPHVTPLNLASAQSVERYMLRHLVKPGITGWAQVNGSRGETTAPGAMHKRVQYDLYYIHSWTFWLDCQIILQTIINIIKGDENAY